MSLVCIHETENASEALVIKSTLEAYGLFVSAAGLDIAQQFQVTIPPLTTIRIMVSEIDEAAARAIISPSDVLPGSDSSS